MRFPVLLLIQQVLTTAGPHPQGDQGESTPAELHPESGAAVPSALHRPCPLAPQWHLWLLKAKQGKRLAPGAPPQPVRGRGGCRCPHRGWTPVCVCVTQRPKPVGEGAQARGAGQCGRLTRLSVPAYSASSFSGTYLHF